MEALTGIITAFGLSGSAGLNAYIPLLLVAVLGRFEVIKLSSPFDILTSWPAIIAIGVLLVIELVVDKVPGADHVNDVVQTFVRPAAGAVLFAANTGVITSIDPTVALIIGLVLAMGVHGAKVATRPVVNATTMGVGAPFISLAEDAVSAIGSLLAIFFPVVFLFFVAALTFVIWRVIKGVRSVRRKLANEG
jgi:Domain of unknown function (DUF4126)